jgi:hypothetical protein
MKKIKESLLIKILQVFVGTIFFLLVSIYLLVRSFILEHSLNSHQILVDFNFLFLEIFFIALVVLFFVFYFIQKKYKNLKEDIDAIKSYLQEVSEDKNYYAVIKIKNYIEFLEISLILKNIVKRLHQKTKKASKK